MAASETPWYPIANGTKRGHDSKQKCKILYNDSALKWSLAPVSFTFASAEDMHGNEIHNIRSPHSQFFAIRKHTFGRTLALRASLQMFTAETAVSLFLN